MGATCSRTVTEIIPDKEVMMDIVEMITKLEEMAKRGEKLTKAQNKKRSAALRVAKQMRHAVKVVEDTRVD